MLGDAQAPVRAAALSALRGVEGFRDASVAVPLLGDADADVRTEALYMVGQLRARDTAAAVANVLVTDGDASVRKRAAWALGEMAAPVAVAGAALTQAATSDPSPFVRSLARGALGKLAR